MTTLKAALKEVCYLELEDIPSEEVLSADDGPVCKTGRQSVLL